jgi:hypothetical protein
MRSVLQERSATVLPDHNEALDYGTTRVRKRTAVVLVAPPVHIEETDPSMYVPRTRFVPLVCVVNGVLFTGLRCGEAMPARTKIRSTYSGESLATNEFEVERTRTPSINTDGSKLMPPYAFACCMYNTCVGKTVPYSVVEDGDWVVTNRRTLIGVWPMDAEVDLRPLAFGVDEDVDVHDAPWLAPGTSAAQAGPNRIMVPMQAFARGTRRYAALGAWPMDGSIFADTGSGWTQILRRFAPLFMLATTDVDGDGRPELLAYESWVNDYGLDVFVNDAPAPAYQFSCGNI